jgi:hypothetical protein
MEKAIFEIEVHNGEYEQFEGITFGQLWNGWQCPQFDIHNIKKILEGILNHKFLEVSLYRLRKDVKHFLTVTKGILSHLKYGKTKWLKMLLKKY